MTISHTITKSGHYCHTKTILMFQLIPITEFLIRFEAWTKLAQQWLVWECILSLLTSDNIIVPSGPKRELCSANGAPYEFIKNTNKYENVCLEMYLMCP